MGRTIVACAAVVLVAGALAGCREEEQGRRLSFDKGTYTGPADTALSKAQMDELTNRAALQGGDIGSAAGGPPAVDSPPRTTQERAPESSTALPEKALSDRVRMQSGN
jgi:hypothetical protein